MLTDSFVARLHLCSRAVGFLKVFLRLGVANGFRFKIAQYRSRLGPERFGVSEVRSRRARGTLRLRNGTSDWRVFHQIFVELQYSIVPAAMSPTLIVDAGANIGLSACYLLSRFPKARLIGIEPDASNLKLAEANLEPYGERSALVLGAVWSEPTVLELHQPGDAATDHWAIQARPAAAPAASTIRGYTLEEILVQAGAGEKDRILLKMDIEGAERFVFAAASDELMARFEAIAIELHGQEATRVFFSRVEGGFSVASRGETTYAERRGSP